MRRARWSVGVGLALTWLVACGPAPQPLPVTPAAPIPARISKAGNPVYRVHPRDPKLERVAGEKAILPDRDDRAHGRLEGSFELCLDETGRYENGFVLRSTGSVRYDAKIAKALMAWAFRPYLVDGVAVPICTTIVFIFSSRGGRPPM